MPLRPPAPSAGRFSTIPVPIGNRVIEEQLMILFFLIHLWHAGDISMGKGKIIKLIDSYDIS